MIQSIKYSTLFLLLITQGGFSQISDTYEENASFQSGSASTPFIRVSTKSGNKIVGDIYLNTEWEQATIFDLMNKRKIKLLARFNAYSSEIEFLTDEEIKSLSPVEGISVLLNDRTFVPFKAKVSAKSIFAEQLFKGNPGLFKVYGVKINKAISDAALLNLENVDKVAITEKLYYQKGDQSMVLPSKKKSFNSILDQQSLQFAKNEKLSLKKESDLIRIFEFYHRNKTSE